MSRITFALATVLSLALPLSACMEIDYESAYNLDFTERPVEGGFNATERERTTSYNLASRPGDVYVSRVGDLAEGLSYGFRSQGSQALFGYITSTMMRDQLIIDRIWGWSCTADQMDGGIDCTVLGNDKGVPDGREVRFIRDETIGSNSTVRLLMRGSRPPYKLCVAYHDFPGRSARIRIDGGSPISLGGNGCTTSQGLIRRFMTANSVFVEGVSWPYDATITREVDMRGMPEAIDILQHALQR